MRPLADTASQRDLLGAMGEVQQVCHGDKGVVQRLDGGDSFVRVDCQHLRQQIYELPSVCLLCQHVTSLQVRRHVHLYKTGWASA